MAEKYRGILPPKSVWFQMDSMRAAIILLKASERKLIDPEFQKHFTFCNKNDHKTEILAPKDQAKLIEEILKSYGEEIKTLY